ncbi:MAG: sigma 54-interacting transcriptional regulator [Gemmatimonadaceae bacterium]
MITLADVEPAVRLNALLEGAELRTVMVSPLDDMPSAIRRERPDVIVLTGNLLDASNMALVRQQLWDGGAVIGLADVDDPAVADRMRALGFAEVFSKPVDPADVFGAVNRVFDRRRLQSLIGLLGDSEAIREVLVRVEQIAPVSSTVLVEGESGTGKELVARGIHQLSPRRGRPFISVNVGALPETLLESELFGHEKGAFTGAAERRLGRFELANGGTLFLDEIGDIPPSTQVKLLRVLEERTVTRVGGTQPLKVDVRVVAATNRSLRGQVEEGSFRSDLYYRLNVLRVYLPPLRERREDIPLLVRRFVQTIALEHDRTFHGISAEAMERLVGYSWPGNVRELRNLVENMVVLSPGREIVPEDLPRVIREGGVARFLPVHVGPILRATGGTEGRELEFIVRSLVELKLQVEELRRRLDSERPGRGALLGSGGDSGPDGGSGGGSGVPGTGAFVGVGAIEPRGVPEPPNVVTIPPGMKMAEIERAVIEAALKEKRGNRRRAAELLGIGERTLYRKLKEYQMREYGMGETASGSLD